MSPPVIKPQATWPLADTARVIVQDDLTRQAVDESPWRRLINANDRRRLHLRQFKTYATEPGEILGKCESFPAL